MGRLLKNIPNFITIFRIVASVPLLLLPPLTVPFYVLYTICGFSDVLDGTVARRWHLQSALGARLDSLADLLFWGIVLIRVLPVLWPRFGLPELVMLCVIAALRLVNYGVALAKFHAFPALHTWLNKLTACGLFAAAYLLHWVPLRVIAVILFVIALAAVGEELMIHLTSQELKPDVHSLRAARSKGKKET